MLEFKKKREMRFKEKQQTMCYSRTTDQFVNNRWYWVLVFQERLKVCNQYNV